MDERDRREAEESRKPRRSTYTPRNQGVVTLSAFAPAVRVWSQLQRGIVARFIEDDLIPRAQLSWTDGSLWYGSVQDLGAPGGWERFEPTLEGVKEALRSNMSRLFTWRYDWFVGRAEYADRVDLIREYWALCNKSLARCKHFSQPQCLISTAIERAALFAHFQQAERSLMYDRGFVWARHMAWIPRHQYFDTFKPITHNASNV